MFTIWIWLENKLNILLEHIDFIWLQHETKFLQTFLTLKTSAYEWVVHSVCIHTCALQMKTGIQINVKAAKHQNSLQIRINRSKSGFSNQLHWPYQPLNVVCHKFFFFKNSVWVAYFRFELEIVLMKEKLTHLCPCCLWTKNNCRPFKSELRFCAVQS